jgi:hypothetical protein
VTFDHDAERQARDAVEVLLTTVADAVRRQLDTVRAEFDGRLAGLAPTVPPAERDDLVTHLVEAWLGAAAEEAEQAARPLASGWPVSA